MTVERPQAKLHRWKGSQLLAADKEKGLLKKRQLSRRVARADTGAMTEVEGWEELRLTEGCRELERRICSPGPWHSSREL